MEDFKYEPAHDMGLSLPEAAKSPDREAGLISRLCGRLLRVVLWLWFKWWHRLKVEGSFPKDAKPCIVVANHSSHLDALVLLLSLPIAWRKDACPLAAGDVFFPGPLRAILSATFLSALPVWRGKGGRHQWESYRRNLVEKKQVYILFPEGMRSSDGALLPFKSGWARLVCQLPEVVPIVPCHITGAHEALAKGRCLPRPRKITIRIGAPLLPGPLEDKRQSWDELTATVRVAVETLIEEDRPAGCP